MLRHGEQRTGRGPSKARPPWLLPLLGIALGGAAGYGYYALVGCTSGGCAITSDPFFSSLYGAIIGLVLGGWQSGQSTQAGSTRRKENEMPLYDYRCESCGKEFEVLRRRGDDSTEACPDCGREARKQLSAFAVGGGADSTSSVTTGGSNCNSWSGG